MTSIIEGPVLVKLTSVKVSVSVLFPHETIALQFIDSGPSTFSKS